MEERQKILIVEDDARLAGLIRDYLVREGYAVFLEERGDRAQDCITRERPDLVILDLMLPGKDGLSVCRDVRTDFEGPILILTAREDDMDQVAGLELGADDYVKKPVEPRVLLARIRALFRRMEKPGSGRHTADTSPEGHDIRFGSLRIDTASRSVFLEGSRVDLTTNEFDLLLLLARNEGTVLSRDTIYSALRGIGYDGIDRSVDMYISRLRKKLGDDTSHPARIKTVWGSGYLFVRDAW
ncbi:MAG TPA: winged helix-turn-helix domain-containing protein [Desulfomonilia bacterium]|nr:winged helix-turn-helix domain-containing protein [Desulfomonilia bacterium]